MPVCSYGSEPKPTSPDWFTYQTADLVSWLPNIFGFVTNALMGIPTAPQKTSDFCATEPTGGLPSSGDYALLAFPPLALISGVYQRFGNQVRQEQFNALCQCAGPPGGTCTDLDGTSTNLQTFGIVGGSYTFGTKFKILTAGQITHVRYQGSGLGSQQTAVRTRIKKVGGSVIYDQTITVPTTSGMHDFSCGPFTTVVGEEYIVYWDNNAGVENLYYSSPSFPYTSGSCQIEGGVGTTSSGDHTAVESGGDGNQHWPMVLHCVASATPYPAPPAITPPTGFPSAPAAPTCTTDQDICNTLAQIDQKLNVLDLELNALQRFGAPMAYTLGTPHNSLTGNGSIAASAILGALVSLTTVPGGWGRTSDTPPRYVPTVGAIQAESADGYSDWEQVHYAAQLVMFRNPWASAIHYSFRQGVTATVTPLLAPL